MVKCLYYKVFSKVVNLRNLDENLKFSNACKRKTKFDT